MSAKKKQELLDLHWNAPQLEIIDDAIDSIEKGRHNYCCVAIKYCLFAALAEPKIDYDSKYALVRLYQYQFARFCLNSKNKKPRWWSSPPSPNNKIRRLKALRAFRQACLDAAKT